MADKSSHADREERILAFWKENQIFEKSLAKNKDSGKEFVFYEGPPTANGRPGIHHIEARSFKDAIPRYKTMQGFYVRRKGGWDTHGLPVELAVEKELGLKSKKEIENYGIKAFNEKCKDSVWTFVHEWEDFTNRMGYWVDLNDPYITYKPEYIESVWNVIKTVEEKKLLYKDYKVLPWCPRCGTALSSHELAQGYETVKDLSVYAKFKVKEGQKIDGFVADKSTFLVAWTTTPWTLPGNVALAIGEKIDYIRIRVGVETLILAKERLGVVKEVHTLEEEFKGRALVGVEYEPLYPFMRSSIIGPEKDKIKNAYKVYPADFVTTTDGTGIVHTAVMYGQEDFDLGTKVGLPKHHLVNEDGTFKNETGFLAGKFVKDEATDVEIIKDLAHRGLLFHKEKFEHSYPHCWRCKTPLIYFARDSWYIRMSDLRHKLVSENENIHWEPAHIKEGRFGEWLREVKDWAISRERYWGTPLPVWTCDKCPKRKVIGSLAEVSEKARNEYYIMRHGEADNNVLSILSATPETPHHLTEKGKVQVVKVAEKLKKIKFDFIFVSPFVRTQETMEILKEKLHWKKEQIHTDPRLGELNSGVWNGRKVEEFQKEFQYHTRFLIAPEKGESYSDIKKRVGNFLYETDAKYKAKKILIISHESPALLLISAARGLSRKQSMDAFGSKEHIDLKNAEFVPVHFKVFPHNDEYELDLHRPYIDDVKFDCKCGGKMTRVKEVMDVWLDSGSMPFAQDHYPFEKDKSGFLGLKKTKEPLYPADFISEGIDQTRGWFYTLHAVGALMGRGKAFKNVISLGLILDAQGKKMSKSLGNTVDPMELMNKYGADALRFWMYSVNQPGDAKNFDEKTVDEVIKKVLNLATNVTSFYKMYAKPMTKPSKDSVNVLDLWILSRLDEVVANVTKNLDAYVFLEPTRMIRDFVGDLSQWYLRRSRDRFKEEGPDKEAALATTKYVLLTLAKLLAPFMPFFAEYLHQEVVGDEKSVHLEAWPKAGEVDQKLIEDMNFIREVASRGLEARMTAKINVRQPLSKLSVHDPKIEKLHAAIVQLIMDEVNVKQVSFVGSLETDVALDTTITPELKEEGDVRELLRKIQDMRKDKGLTVNDTAVLIATDAEKPLISGHEMEIRAAARLSSIEYGDKFELKA